MSYSFLLLLPVPAPASVQQGQKSVSFIIAPFVQVYHWDSCQRKNVAIDFDVSASSSTAMSDFRYRILLEFYDEGLRENFRLYTLPRDFTDVNQRSRIESWGEILQYLTNLRQSITRSPLLYVFNNDDDLSPTKLPVPIVVQQHAATSESNSQSSKSSRDKRAADSVRERDGNTKGRVLRLQ